MTVGKIGKGDALMSVRSLGKALGYLRFIGNYSTFFALLALVVVFAQISPMFFTSRNLINVLRQISLLTIAATGLTVCRAAGELDLSVGGLAALAGITVAKLTVEAGLPVGVAILITLLLGGGFGLINGFLVSLVKIPSLIATLGTLSIASGTALFVTGGKAIYAEFPRNFAFLGQGYFLNIPMPAVIMIFVVIVVYILLEKTVVGRHLYAIGENPLAARLVGLPIVFYRIIIFVISSMTATVSGVVLVARLGSGQPTAGGEYLLEGLGSVFIGMTVFRAGQANILGTLTGAFIVGVIANGLLLMGLSPYVQDIIKGLIMILAVIAAVYKEEIRI